MRKTLVFHNFEQYEEWTEQFESVSDYQEVPCAIDDGWKVSVDLFTECKSYKTALRRFAKAFAGVHKDIGDWVECMKESCENGYFGESDGWKPAHSSDPKEVAEWAKNGIYSWGIEETTEGYWYVFLNISGLYAGRKREAV